MNRLLRVGTTQPWPTEPARELRFPRIVHERGRHVKRFLDILFSTGLAIAALPLIVLIAFAIKLTSRGSVFYAHPRIGRAGKRFRVLKFRTMRVDSDEFLERYLREHPEQAREWNLNHKLKDDPRVTAVGRLLRRTSLDELPQIWNVLRGEMSMVGPRPIVEQEVAKYGQAYVLYAQVKPGLTGLWQVSGRNDTNYRRRVELDTEYIRTWTPAKDFSIILRTFGAVVKGKGAY